MKGGERTVKLLAIYRNLFKSNELYSLKADAQYIYYYIRFSSFKISVQHCLIFVVFIVMATMGIFWFSRQSWRCSAHTPAPSSSVPPIPLLRNFYNLYTPVEIFTGRILKSQPTIEMLSSGSHSSDPTT